MEETEREIEEIKKLYKNTREWLKTPSGKLSKLPEILWLLVRTPKFKEWFGDWEAELNAKMAFKRKINNNVKRQRVYKIRN